MFIVEVAKRVNADWFNAFHIFWKKRCETLRRSERFHAFCMTDVKRVKPVSINAFCRYGKTRFENASFSQKFTPWVAFPNSDFFIFSSLKFIVGNGH